MSCVRPAKVFALACLSVALLTPSCEAPKERQKVIGVSLLTQGHVFYQELEAGLRDAAAKEGFKLVVNYGEWDLAKHVSQLENFIVQRVDAILVSPCDSEGIGPTIVRANEARIPVFTCDIAAHGGDVVSHIASDNVAGGRLAGEYLAKLLGGTGTVAIIDQPETRSCIDRVAGFEETIKRYPEMPIVAKPTGHGVRDQAMRATEDLLQAHPEVNAIFGINDDTALGALAAVEAANKQNSIVIIGYDATPEARDTIMRGTALKADVIQHPKNIGEETIKTIAQYFRGEQVPKIIPVEVGIVDKVSLEAEASATKKSP
jgi:ribose transport system substrate-binding protein